jgi:hypothetical protein
MTADWLLIGKDAVREYLQNASDYKLKKWLAAGMPVFIDSGEWVAHKKNLEDFFVAYTRRQKIVENIPQERMSRKN